jgi:serine/threonine protein kinase
VGFKGERIGRFILDRKAASVPEGEVWKARADGGPSGAAFAVKLFYDAEWAAVLRASGIPETIEHPNVARIVDGSTSATTPYIVQELHEGVTLRELLAAQRYLPLAGALPAAIQIVRGLAALHKAGLAHYDLRPTNVVLDERGGLKLVDATSEAFRRAVLAKLFDKLRPLPKERAEELSAYLPPEQKKGDVLGGSGDMYAFGVMLYEMLTGERPQGFEVRMPSQRDKRIPKVLDEIVLRSIERSPRARSPSAAGLEQQLLEGIGKAGFYLDFKADPAGWVKATPWRTAGQAVGEETGKFTSTFTRLAKPRE